ncbi:MAG: exonuclease SbcCD subunit D [Candidatus Nitrosotenuis sp.]|nr:MAG: exonuclease SbcCD subunit D [Candidatus Nitrosotenuis sp.]
MRVLHTADNHIGETDYQRIDYQTGLNARGVDFLNSFKNIADIAIKEKVDVLLIAGDFFTKVNPHPRYTLEVIRKLKQVSKRGITTLIVGGNHETPKIATTLNPLVMLGEIDGVLVVLEPTTVHLNGYDFVCVPAPQNFDEIRNLFEPLLVKAMQNSKSNRRILVTHIPLGQAVTSSEVAFETFIGDYVDVNQIPSKFDYVALGHIHKLQKIPHDTMAIYYPGSSERYEFGEERDDKYALIVEFDEDVKVSPIKLLTRKMVTLVDADCSKLSAIEITKLVVDKITQQKDALADCLVRIKLENIDIDENRLIDWKRIKAALEEAKVFEYKLQPRTVVTLPESKTLSGDYILPPSKEVELYIKDKEQYKGKITLLNKLANEIIVEAREMMPSET